MSTRFAAALLVVSVLVVSPAHASNPLEYPDNGAAAFSRGGAWLATANEPIATHYNPAGLVTQRSGFSVDVQLAFAKTCFDRREPGNVRTGPEEPVSGPSFYLYDIACSARRGFPTTLPSVAVAFRASERVALGFAIVPPATYPTAQGQFPLTAMGTRTDTGERLLLPAPYRYMQVEQQSTILFPTASVAVELAKHLRVGAGFVAGIGVINLSTVGVASLGPNDEVGDHMQDDSLSRLRTRDLFVPGATASIHWSAASWLDLALWGRFMDSIRASSGSLEVTQQLFNSSGGVNPPCAPAPGMSFAGCGKLSVPNQFPDAVTRFTYPIPPEARAGVRFHLPRPDAAHAFHESKSRDPLHDDVFDVELNASYSWNSRANVIEVRFQEEAGRGALVTEPTKVRVPPNADRATGYRDSWGLRLGGQWNVVRDVFGVRAGGWFESESQDARFLTVAPVGAARFGFGGGVVLRYGSLDVSLGYQRHVTQHLDNQGFGAFRAPAGTQPPPEFDLGQEPPGVSAANRTQFRTRHAVNGGSVWLEAHVFTLGGTVRF